MQPRHILPQPFGAQKLRLDLVEIERGGVDQPRAWRAMAQHSGGTMEPA